MILFIDDDLAGLRPYRLALEGHDFTVVAARTAHDALEILQETSADISLIILDVMLPTGNALEDEDTEQGLVTGRVLFECFQRDYPTIPVLVLSVTESRDFDVRDVHFLGKDDTLPGDLVQAVKKMLRGGPEEPQ